MKKYEKEYLKKLTEHAAETRRLFSNAQKPERERKVVRAFLRCLGIEFSDDEINAGQAEPIDVAFRSARFQVTELLDEGRKRGDEWRKREQRYRSAESVLDVVEPAKSPKDYSTPAMSFGEIATCIVAHLSNKVERYGERGCSDVDALVYVNLEGRYLWPTEADPNLEALCNLRGQRWRSASVLFLPYSIVMNADKHAPSFLLDKVGCACNAWSRSDGWFDP